MSPQYFLTSCALVTASRRRSPSWGSSHPSGGPEHPLQWLVCQPCGSRPVLTSGQALQRRCPAPPPSWHFSRGSAFLLTLVLLHRVCFFLAPLRIFSFSLVLRNLIYSVSCCSFLHVPWLGFFELTGESEFTVFLKFQSSWPFRLQVFFLPRSPRSHYMCMRPREVAPQLTAAPFISLRSFFLCVSF